MKHSSAHTRLMSIKPWLIWGLAAFFFFAHYIVRVTPGHITEDLQASFMDTTKYDLGILGASFYFPYVLMQMPVGYLVDRFGSRLLLTIAILIAALSCFIFSGATQLKMAILSRVLLGFCSATAFISALKLTTVWFAPTKLALLVGITQALGMIGASVGAHIVPYLNEAIGWKNAFNLYTFVFFGLAFLVFAVVRDAPPQRNLKPSAQTKTIRLDMPIKAILKCKYTWINALYAGLIYAPTDAIGEYWGKEFLYHIHEISPLNASHALSFLFLGWAIGGPLAGFLADRIGRKRVMIISAAFGCILIPCIFYWSHLSATALMALLFIYGLTNTGLIASYTLAGELYGKAHGGFSIAIANMFSVLLGAVFIILLGWLLQWIAHNVNHHSHYTSLDYQLATLIFPICMILALICALFSKETLMVNKNSQ